MVVWIDYCGYFFGGDGGFAEKSGTAQNTSSNSRRLIYSSIGLHKATFSFFECTFKKQTKNENTVATESCVRYRPRNPTTPVQVSSSLVLYPPLGTYE
jgi:hypothetical protein